MLEDMELYALEEGSPGLQRVFEEVVLEVRPFLSPSGQHWAIVRLDGVIVDHLRRPGKLLFELADLGSLEDFIKATLAAAARGQCVVDPAELSWDAVGHWMCDSIAGLTHMHHCGLEALLHRDQKPENLRVLTLPGAGAGEGAGAGAGAGPGAGAGAGAGVGAGPGAWRVRVKLGDFNLAKAVEAGRSHLSSDVSTGNLLCKAPEVLDPKTRGHFSASADVYSWAACMCVVVMSVHRPGPGALPSDVRAALPRCVSYASRICLVERVCVHPRRSTCVVCLRCSRRWCAV